MSALSVVGEVANESRLRELGFGKNYVAFVLTKVDVRVKLAKQFCWHRWNGSVRISTGLHQEPSFVFLWELAEHVFKKIQVHSTERYVSNTCGSAIAASL